MAKHGKHEKDMPMKKHMMPEMPPKKKAMPMKKKGGGK